MPPDWAAFLVSIGTLAFGILCGLCAGKEYGREEAADAFADERRRATDRHEREVLETKQKAYDAGHKDGYTKGVKSEWSRSEEAFYEFYKSHFGIEDDPD